MPHDPRDPLRRQAVFTLADSRGNNPHGTRESADHEGRRLNSYRYETVDQAAARQRGGGTHGVPQQLGQVAPSPVARSSPIGDLLGLVIGVGVLGAAAWLLFGPPAPSTAATPPSPPEPAPLPALAAPSPVVVVQAPAPALPAPNPAPIIDVKATPVRARRRRRAKVEPTTVNVTVTPPPTA